MSADYDRLFNADPPAPGELTETVDRDAIAAHAAKPTPPPIPPMPVESAPPPMPVNGPQPTQPTQPPQTTDQPPQPPQAPPVAPPRVQQAPPQARPAQMPAPPSQPSTAFPRPATRGATVSAGARFEQPRQAPPPPPRVQPPPAPSQHFAETHTNGDAFWTTQNAPSQPAPTSAATMGNHSAIDALSHVGVRSVVKMPSQRGWRHWLYLLTRLNLGLSPDERYEFDLHNRVRRNARDSYQIGVLGLKGGVGKTAVTVALGSALARVRGDRILAVDVDPAGGNLADRIGRQSAATIADLLSDQELMRYNDIRAHTSMNDANLEVLSSEEYSGARRALNGDDWKGAVDIVSRYYNLVLADCGCGLFDAATQSVLSTVSGVVIVASATIDGARQAAVTMDWLRQNGYQDLLARACVVINHVVPGKPNIDVNDLVQQFERHLQPGRIVVLPWDKHIAAGTEIQLNLLDETYQRRILELAAALSDDFDRLERR